MSNISSLNSTTAFTYSTWVNLKSKGSYKAFVSKASSGDGNNRSVLGTSNGATGGVWVDVSNGSSSGGDSVKLLSTDIWYYLTLVYDGTQTGNANRLKLYINGLQDTITFYGTIPATATASTYGQYIGTENGLGGFR